MMNTTIIKLIKTLLFWVVLVWCVGSSIWAFVGIQEKSIDYLPAWLPFPWSGVADFVATPNGEVYAASELFKKIARYDSTGGFIALYPSPSQYAPLFTRLAVGEDGSIYVQTPDAIYTGSLTPFPL